MGFQCKYCIDFKWENVERELNHCFFTELYLNEPLFFVHIPKSENIGSFDHKNICGNHTSDLFTASWIILECK